MTDKRERLLKSLIEIENAFEQKDEQFKEFLEIAPEGILVLDIEKRTFSMCNQNAQDLLKYSTEELLEKGPRDLSPEFQPCGKSSIELIENYIKKACQGERPVFEWITVDNTGRTFFAEVRLTSLMNTETPYIYASFVDITDRKEAQLKIEAQNTKLKEIAFLQSHQVRGPVANVLGIINLFDFKDLSNPLNPELLQKLRECMLVFDERIRQITLKTSEIQTEIANNKK
jgi:PAS domain S-box-containing protein